MPHKAKKITFAILGFGTVGRGLAELWDLRKNRLLRQRGLDLRLKAILDLKIDKASKFSDLMTTDASIIMNDNDIDLVVECIGGATVAHELSLQVIHSGKHLVSSNKELISTYGETLLQEAAKQQVYYRFEASTGGGMPILSLISEDLAANTVESLFGIVNGTTNYILSRMTKEGATLDTVLKDAQRLGYAELDPTSDIEGYDSQRKLSILASMLYKEGVPCSLISCKGISSVSSKDIAWANALGYSIKLIARLVRQGDFVTLSVSPCFLPKTHLLSQIDGVQNAVMMQTDACGPVVVCGEGAGAFPTASAIMADIIAIAELAKKDEMFFELWNPVKKSRFNSPQDRSTAYVFRFSSQQDLDFSKEQFPQAELHYLENDDSEYLLFVPQGVLSEEERQEKIKNFAEDLMLASYPVIVSS